MAERRLVLLGGGHAQLHVLRQLAAMPLPGWSIRLITPYPRLLYSGMLPGWIAGHYSIEQCSVPLEPLARAARARVHWTAATGLDLDSREVRCADDRRVGFDLLSIDTGPQPAIDQLPGAAEHALPVRPIERFVAAWPALLDRMRAGRAAPSASQLQSRADAHRGAEESADAEGMPPAPRAFRVVVLGAGAAGVEIAFGIRHRAKAEGWPVAPQITLAGSDALPLPGAPEGLRRRIASRLAERDIAWHGGCAARAIVPGEVQFESSEAEGAATSPAAPLPFDACLVVTGAAAPEWPAADGLSVDDRGFIRVDDKLQSPSHRGIFAAGDVAAYRDARPKSGVYALRAGPPLAINLHAAASDAPLQPWRPQRRALALISTGERHAVASWGPLHVGGGWVWRWKDWIDRGFVRGFGGMG